MSRKYINQLAIKCNLLHQEEDFEELLAIVYKICGVGNKIRFAIKKSYIPYTSEEDFFSVYYLALQKCVKTYNTNIGDFRNYVSKQISVMFAEEKKQSFLKITGQPSKNIEYKSYGKPVEDLDFSIKKAFIADEEMMNEKMINILKNIEDGNLLIYKYLSGPKIKTNKEVAIKFGLTERQVRTRIEKVNQQFKKNNNSFFEDYFYDTNEEFIWVNNNFDNIA